jgi:hypothetical protein
LLKKAKGLRTFTCSAQFLIAKQPLDPEVFCTFNINLIFPEVPVPNIPPFLLCSWTRLAQGKRARGGVCARHCTASAKWFLYQAFNCITTDAKGVQCLFRKLTRDFLGHRVLDPYKGKQVRISSEKDIRTSGGWRHIWPSDAVVDGVSKNPPPVLLLKNASYMLCNWIGAATHNRYVETALIEEACQ